VAFSTSISHLLRRARPFPSKIAIASLALAMVAFPLRPAIADGPREAFLLDNGLLRFGGLTSDRAGCGDMTFNCRLGHPATAVRERESVRADGRLDSAFYWSGDTWWQLANSQAPFDFAIGAGTGGTTWHQSAQVLESRAGAPWPQGSEFPWDKLGTWTSSVVAGSGTLTYSGAEVAIAGGRLGADLTYRLPAGRRAVEVTMTVRNLDTTPAENIRVWVGVFDDWLGSSDDNSKSRGNLVDGEFVPLAAASEASSAIRVFNADDTLILYTTYAGGRSDTIIDEEYEYVLVTPLAPSGQKISSTNSDGSYGLTVLLGDIPVGASRTFTYFLGAGPTGDVDDLVTAIFAAGVESQRRQEIAPQPPVTDPTVTFLLSPDGTTPSAASGTAVWQQADGTAVPLTVSSPAPGQVRYEADGVRLTLTGAAGTNTSRGLVANPNGEVECEICATLAAGGVIEAWMFSTPRLVAAWSIADLPCQRFTIPVASPLDGGGAVSAGAHTLQLVLPTAQGMQAVNVGVTVGGPVPGAIPAGDGPTAPARLDVLPLLLLAGAAAVAVRRLVATV
jgi:hypothetical protein